jgi:hypothetical protein
LKTAYPVHGFSWYFSVPIEKCWDRTLKQAIIASFHILANSSFHFMLYELSSKERKRNEQTKYKAEEFYLLGCNAAQSIESQLTFQKNMSPPSSGSKNKQSLLLKLSQKIEFFITTAVRTSNPTKCKGVY